jgi:hypothetical protein
MPGEPIYDHTAQITQVTEYGVTLDTNPIQVWAPQAVDFAKGEIRFKAYAPD